MPCCKPYDPLRWFDSLPEVIRLMVTSYGRYLLSLGIAEDEVCIRSRGEMRYRWRALDHEGEGLESFVTKERATGG